MTREDITKEYKVENGIIISPGKFEGQALYAPYFWDILMNGGANYRDDGNDGIFETQEEDIDKFPELEGYDEVILTTNEQGFVSIVSNVYPY